MLSLTRAVAIHHIAHARAYCCFFCRLLSFSFGFLLGWDYVLSPLGCPYYPEKHLPHSRLTKKCVWLVSSWSDSMNKATFSFVAQGEGENCFLFFYNASLLFLSFSWETLLPCFTSWEGKLAFQGQKKYTEWRSIHGMGLPAFPGSLLLGLKRNWPSGMFLHFLVLCQSAAVPMAHISSGSLHLLCPQKGKRRAGRGRGMGNSPSFFSGISMAPFDSSRIRMWCLLLTKTQRSGSPTEHTEGQFGGTAHGGLFPRTGRGWVAVWV